MSALIDALRRAEQFISNGVALGFIRLPDADVPDTAREVLPLVRAALAAAEAQPSLHEIEQYRMQMAAISSAALGYWTESDGILPEYDTVPLRDVAKLYAKYAALYKAAAPAAPAGESHAPR